MPKLNIASGANMFFSGWTNIDKVDMRPYLDAMRTRPTTGMPAWQARFVERLQAGEPLEFQVHDVREGILSPDDSVDLIYIGQFIEHLNPVHEAPQFLRECHRVLKPGGILRMSTPDLDLLLEAYLKGSMMDYSAEQPAVYAKARTEATRLGYIMFGSLGPDSTNEHYEGHHMCYNQDSMTELLEDAGFQEIAFLPPNRSRDPTMEAEVLDMGTSHSLFVEARKAPASRSAPGAPGP